MRTRSIISGEGTSTRINVTPMIDVVMVLIVFYLLVGQLAIDRKAAIDLPASSTGIEQNRDLDPIVIGIRQDGSLSINGQAIERERFAGEIRGLHLRNPGTPIQIRAHRLAAYGVIRPVITHIRDLEIPTVELVTEQQR